MPRENVIPVAGELCRSSERGREREGKSRGERERERSTSRRARRFASTHTTEKTDEAAH